MAIMKLVVFDVDGTLVDSQAHISKAMRLSFERHGLPAPEVSQVRSIIGLSLAEAIQKIVPEGSKTLYKKLILMILKNIILRMSQLLTIGILIYIGPFQDRLQMHAQRLRFQI